MRTIRRSAFAAIAAAWLSAQSACGHAGPTVVPPARLATVAAANPMPTGPTVVDIDLSATDGVSIDGASVDSLAELLNRLKTRADAPKMRGRDGSSRLDLVLRADASLPWAVVCWTLMTGADEKVAAYRVHFAVRHRASREVGALSVALPKSGSLCCPRVERPPP